MKHSIEAVSNCMSFPFGIDPGSSLRGQCCLVINMKGTTQESAQRLIFERENTIPKVGNYSEDYTTYILFREIV